jgi:hypothetical protein
MHPVAPTTSSPLSKRLAPWTVAAAECATGQSTLTLQKHPNQADRWVGKDFEWKPLSERSAPRLKRCRTSHPVKSRVNPQMSTKTAFKGFGNPPVRLNYATVGSTHVHGSSPSSLAGFFLVIRSISARVMPALTRAKIKVFNPSVGMGFMPCPRSVERTV